MSHPLPLAPSKILPINGALIEATIQPALEKQIAAQIEYNDASTNDDVDSAINNMNSANNEMNEANRLQTALNVAATNAMNIANKKAQDILDVEQTRINGLLSATATAKTFSTDESGDFDQAAQTKYGISGLHKINTRDELIAYLRSQGQHVDEASDA